MKIVFFSLILNNHQACVADALWELTKHDYCFVELANLQAEHRKGDTHDYSDRPYLLRAWQSPTEYSKAMELATTAECCVFSGIQAMPFQKERLKRTGLLSFDMSERWLKRGFVNLFSPNIFRMFTTYHMEGWGRKPLYKLCCSAFAAHDQRQLGMFSKKCYKWGYFTQVEKLSLEALTNAHTSNDATSLMWCSRYLKLKHPELPILIAHRLRNNGYRFTLDMYGSGEYEQQAQQLAAKLGVNDVVNFVGTKPNTQLMADMRQHEIFLFTSDRNEGWGAVANESMANGCVLVASDGIGCAPYLVENGHTGFLFNSPKTSSSIDHPDESALNALYEKVAYLLDHPTERQAMRQRSLALMQNVWNPHVAAERLLALIDRLRDGKSSIFENGPCSIA